MKQRQRRPALVLCAFLVCLVIYSEGPSMACGLPAPIDCAKSLRVKLRASTLEELSFKVNDFQKHLSANISKSAKPADSCFNSGHGASSVAAVKAYAASHKNFFCPAHLDQVDRDVKALTDSQSAEIKAVTDATAREKLAAEAKGVRTTLDKFIGAHNM